MIYPWQAEQWKQLKRLRQENRLPHALLFSGPAGVGKRSLAQAFAHLVLCLNSKEQDEACGHCHICHLLQAHSHPDFRLVQPEEEGHAIKVDQIRELGEFVQQTAHQGGLRLVIIQPAESLNSAAANALLKTLEEPSPQTLLILISENRARLPITLRSRCQQLRFSTPSHELALNWLASQDSAVVWEPILEAAHGAPLLAHTWQQNGIWSSHQRFMSDLAALTRQETDPFQVAVQWKDSNMLWLFDLFFQWLLKLMRMQEITSEQSRNPHLLEMIDYLQKLRLEVLGPYHLNQQLLLESLFIRWVQYGSC